MRGRQFISRHELFDDVAHHVRKHVDEFAERAGALGGYAEETIRQAVRNSALDEYAYTAISGEEHARALVDRISTYEASIRQGIHRSEKLDDPATVDLFTRLLGELEQDLWFLESHLYGSPQASRTASTSFEIPEGLSPCESSLAKACFRSPLVGSNARA